MQNAEAEFHLMSFPNVKHGFTNPASTENGKKYGMPLFYDAHADTTSWDSLLDFMR
jgi:dienelactone hydrolase